MIYFLRSPAGRIKIGTSVRLSHRLANLAREHGPGLGVLAVVDGARDEEQALHLRFTHLRRVGEWFEPGDDLLGFIVSDGKPWDGRDEIDTLPAGAPRPVLPGPVPDPETAKAKALNVRGRAVWRQWVNDLAEATPNGGKPPSVSDLIERLLKNHASAIGFREPPAR